jgi:hypothetical protein
VTQVCHCLDHEEKLRQLLEDAFAELPAGGHQQVRSIPGIGTATAAVLVAKIIDIERFTTPEHLVGYFGVFPEEASSGVDPDGQPLSPGTLRMSHKGNDLARGYLWNAARSATQHNPAIRALYARLRAKGKRGDVAIGHCMRKLLHLVFAVWKTNRPFDEKHFPWEPPSETPAAAALPAPAPAETAASPGQQEAVGHTQALPAQPVVTTASASVEDTAPSVNAAVPSPTASRPRVDFAFVREQITMERVLRHLGLLAGLRGRGQQLRGCCPIHAPAGAKESTFSVHLGKNAFQCFQAKCGVQGNVLDLWAALHQRPLYEAAVHLAETFGLRRNREEEPVQRTR